MSNDPLHSRLPVKREQGGIESSRSGGEPSHAVGRTIKDAIGRALGLASFKDPRHQTGDNRPSGTQPANCKNAPDLSAKIEAAAHIIDFAFNARECEGLKERMPPNSPFGQASHFSVVAFWEKVLNRSLDEVATEFMRTAPVPDEGERNYMATSPRAHTRVYLQHAAMTDPTVLERALLLVPKYTQFTGAIVSQDEKRGIDPSQEIERLNKICGLEKAPAPMQLQVILVDTDKYGTLEISRYRKDAQSSFIYTIGRDNVSYSISTTHGLSNLDGLFPELLVSDPRSFSFPSFSQLVSAVETQGRNFRHDALNERQATLPEYPPSGPKGLRYCCAEAQASLAEKLPGKDQARIDVVSDSWDTKLRLQVYCDAARSPDVEIRHSEQDSREYTNNQYRCSSKLSMIRHHRCDKRHSGRCGATRHKGTPAHFRLKEFLASYQYSTK